MTNRTQIDIDTLVEHALNTRHKAKKFIPGVSAVPVTGKVFGKPELKAAIEASLDFWLTSGPYTEKFETRRQAIKREQFLKSPKGWQTLLEIKNNFFRNVAQPG